MRHKREVFVLVSTNTAKAWYLVTNTFCMAGNYHSHLFKCN